MNVRFLSPKLHGLADYGAAAGLIIFPFLLGLGQSSSVAVWLSVATGIVVIAASLLTDYYFGALRIIPFKLHLVADLSVALLFTFAPFVLNFSGLDAYFYWANAAVVYGVVLISHRSEATEI